MGSFTSYPKKIIAILTTKKKHRVGPGMRYVDSEEKPCHYGRAMGYAYFFFWISALVLAVFVAVVLPAAGFLAAL
ncbi:MAG TPA: hypothetical protein VHO84_12200, partial [Syntrophorhabdaceae bacterium]|nr:hypothetical protein [Syntrophorhabdaceae bacterium]